MKRIHAFEFEDKEWLPGIFRNYITELVQHLLVSANIYEPIVSLLRGALESVGQDQILDLCSGAAGPMLQVQAALGPEFEVLLSDKYPNLERFRRIRDASNGRIGFIEEPVDALGSIPSHHAGFRTIFSAFHHFRPGQAQRILQNAVDDGRPIGVFEFTERKAQNAVKIAIFGTLLVWIQTPFIKPLRPGRFLWTYLLPVVPFLYCWDAIISHLRTYSVEELRGFVDDLEHGAKYEWTTGQLPANAGFTLTYLIGTPKGPQ